MKRSKKICYGVLSALAIIFGLSLSVSLDTSALKYAYDAYPLFSDSAYLCSDGDCRGTTYHNSTSFSITFDYPGISSTSDIPSGFRSDQLTNYDRSGFDLCQTLNNKSPIFRTFSDNSRHQFIVSSYNGIFAKQPFTNFYPSTYPSCLGYRSTRWSYDHIYGASYNLVTGEPVNLVSIPSFYFKSDDSSDPGYFQGSIKSMTVPLNMANLKSVSSGTLMEWDFGLVHNDDVADFPYFDDNVRTDFSVSYYSLDPATYSYEDFFNSWTTSTGTCTVDTDFSFATSTSDLQVLPYGGVNFHCTFTAPTNMYSIYPLLTIYGSSGPSYNPSNFLTYNSYGLYFSGSYLITDGDDTWSGQVMNATPSGDNMDFNPSYQQLYGTGTLCLATDFLCRLERLFDFTLLNPFQPIFGMFNHGSDCVSIPTIASMIHSNETTVCPWFDSNVRNIATPVVGISGMMLLFGFFVRWLGSRSGNFIEDSGGVDSGGYHFENKFRRGKK